MKVSAFSRMVRSKQGVEQGMVLFKDVYCKLDIIVNKVVLCLMIYGHQIVDITRALYVGIAVAEEP